MVKVKYWIPGSTYHFGEGLTDNPNLDHSQVYHTRYFKSYLLALIFATIMTNFKGYDKAEIEIIDKK